MMKNEAVAIHPYVQRMIAGTNGRMYVERIGKLDSYPIPNIPIEPSTDGLLLDIGCGWGRWVVSAARLGYIPIGMDIKLEAVLAARQVLSDFNLKGYFVVADLKKLPFKAGVFDTVWSYSVIQHTHRRRAYSCVRDIHRVLRTGGFCALEFPTRHGIRNKFVQLRSRENEDDYDSWCVRYYTIKELKQMLSTLFGNFKYWSHCYFSIGIQPVDLRYVAARYKTLILTSMMLAQASRVFPPLKWVSDSVYVRAEKRERVEEGCAGEAVKAFRQQHRQTAGNDNLLLLDLLCCPVSGGDLSLAGDRSELISEQAGLAFPIREGIPVLLEEEARRL